MSALFNNPPFGQIEFSDEAAVHQWIQMMLLSESQTIPGYLLASYQHSHDSGEDLVQTYAAIKAQERADIPGIPDNLQAELRERDLLLWREIYGRMFGSLIPTLQFAEGILRQTRETLYRLESYRRRPWPKHFSGLVVGAIGAAISFIAGVVLPLAWTPTPTILFLWVPIAFYASTLGAGLAWLIRVWSRRPRVETRVPTS